jgi:hypothetical protein
MCFGLVLIWRNLVAILRDSRISPARCCLLVLRSGRVSDPVFLSLDFLHQSFKDAGYLQDFRPLKLHATCMNTIYRRGPRRPFSYSQVLDALDLKAAALPSITSRSSLRGEEAERDSGTIDTLATQLSSLAIDATANVVQASSDSPRANTEPTAVPSQRKGQPPRVLRKAVPVDLGMWRVDEIQVCKLGRGKRQRESRRGWVAVQSGTTLHHFWNWILPVARHISWFRLVLKNCIQESYDFLRIAVDNILQLYIDSGFIRTPAKSCSTAGQPRLDHTAVAVDHIDPLVMSQFLWTDVHV